MKTGRRVHRHVFCQLARLEHNTFSRRFLLFMRAPLLTYIPTTLLYVVERVSCRSREDSPGACWREDNTFPRKSVSRTPLQEQY